MGSFSLPSCYKVVGAPSASPDLSGGNNCAYAITVPVRERGPSAKALRFQRKDAPKGPRVEVEVPTDVVAALRKAGGPGYRAKMTQKGGKHVSRCPGPWVIAFFVLMPPRRGTWIATLHEEDILVPLGWLLSRHRAGVGVTISIA